MGDYEEEQLERDRFEKEQQDIEIRKMKDRADEQMRGYYKNNPAAKSSLDKIMMFTFGVICLILLVFYLVLG